MGNRKQIDSQISDVIPLHFKINYGAGNLLAIEQDEDVPFDIKRVFLVYDVPQLETRGKHAHKQQEQVLISIKGRCDITVKDGEETKNYVLDAPDKGLFIPAGIWDEVTYCSNDSMLLTFADDVYDPNDYIDDWDIFLQFKGGTYED